MKKIENRICKVDGCDRKFFCKEYCRLHYERHYIGNDPERRHLMDKNEAIIKGNETEIILYDKKSIEKARVIIDTDCLPKIIGMKWGLTSHNYARNTLNGILMHRLIIDAPKGIFVDHIDGNPLNNKRSNLRLATNMENLRNMKKIRGISRYKGVSLLKKGNRWISYIRVNTKLEHLGSFKTEIEAAVAYDMAAIDKFGEYASLNFYLDPKTINLNQITWE
jgi:hypothetical protein